MITILFLLLSLTLLKGSNEDIDDSNITNVIEQLKDTTTFEIKQYQGTLSRLRNDIKAFKECLESVKEDLKSDKYETELNKDDLKMNKFGFKKRSIAGMKKAGKKGLNVLKSVNSFFNESFNNNHDKNANEYSNYKTLNNEKEGSKQHTQKMWDKIEHLDPRRQKYVKESLFATQKVKNCLDELRNDIKSDKSELKVNSNSLLNRIITKFKKHILEPDFDLRALYENVD